MTPVQQLRVKLWFNLDQRLSFYNRISNMLNGKIPVVDALSALAGQAKKRKNAEAALLYKQLAEDVAGGKKFQVAFQPWCPVNELMLISAGEEAGELNQGLTEAHFLSKALHDIRWKLIKELASPVLFILMFGLLLYFSSIMILPVLEKLTPLDEWTQRAMIFHAIGYGVKDYAFVIIVSIVIFIIVSVASLPRIKRGSLRTFLDYLPPWSIYKVLSSASFLIAFSGLVRSGVDALSIMRILRENASPWLRSHYDVAYWRIDSGSSTSKALNTGLIEDQIIDDIEIFEELRSFTEAIDEIGKRLVERTEQRIMIVAAFVKTAVIILIVAMIILIILSVVDIGTPVFDKLNHKTF